MRVDDAAEARHAAVVVDERAGLGDDGAFERRAHEPAPQRPVVVARHRHDVHEVQPLPPRLLVESADDCQKPARRQPVDFKPGGRRERHLFGRQLQLADEK